MFGGLHGIIGSMAMDDLKNTIGGEAALKTRISFVVELSRRLHEYGTSAPRLEDVINLVSAKLGLVCNVLSTPTSIVMSFSDPSREDDLAEITQVVRAPPGEVNLKRLCQVDAIADQVIDGRLDLAAGRKRLREFGKTQRSAVYRAWLVASYGISSGSVAAILHTAWIGVAVATLIGLVIGLVYLVSIGRPNIAAAAEALAALLATLIATGIAAFVAPLSVRSVVISSLIVLIPGMSLTTAVRELSSQHLISGTARMMGAFATLLKLAFGTIAAAQVCVLIGWVPLGPIDASVPAWTEWIAVLACGFAFAVLFGSPRRYVPVVVASVVLGYVCAQVGGIYVSPAFGVFAGSLVIGATSNIFARAMQRPGALVREPGIIVLVPGSVGFRSLSFVLERDVRLGIDTAITLMTLLVAIVAGLLFGDLLVPPRRKL
ncbi:MAG: threonine/serine exporter family protein [Dokdonella sp.]